MALLRWKIIKPPLLSAVQELSETLKVDEVISNLLIQREVHTFEQARAFFRPTLDDLHDPFLMKDMDKAVERILKALQKKEKILVFGDYDVDGTTAVALFYSFLKERGAETYFYIPDRYAEGYGISIKGIDFASDNEFSLIVSLDCGIKANDKISYASEKNIDFIICDHHLPGEKLPEAIAILDPKRSDCEYPYKELSGCGIGFKLIQAICLKMEWDASVYEKYLDLVALSIAADIVPITGENRVLAYFGLEQLNTFSRHGFRAVMDFNKLKKPLSISDLVFIIAPRINAAGRIEHGSSAVELLLAEEGITAEEIAKKINQTNTTRKDLDQAITIEAIEMIESSELLLNSKSTVVYNDSWHKGVVGIVASRLVEKYYRPTVVLTGVQGKATGSARSVKDFDVYEAIEACSELLEQFGGHKYAAGLTLPIENIDLFRDKFEEVVNARIEAHHLVPEQEIDAEIDFYQITDKMFRILRQFAPHGPGNMIPVFVSRNVFDTGYAKIVGNNHLKLELYQENNPMIRFQSIAFDKGDFLSHFQKKIPLDICYSITENEWNNKTTIQLNIRDIRISED